MVVLDQGQDQIKGGRHPAAGQDVPVFHDAILADRDIGKPFGKSVNLVPVDRRTPPVQKTRRGEKPASHIHADQCFIAGAGRSEGLIAGQCGVALKVIAGHDKQIIAARMVPERVFGMHRKAAGRGDRATLKAKKLPLI